MRHQHVADAAAAAGQIVDHACRCAGGFEQFHQFGRNHRCAAGRFHDDRIACHHRSGNHSGQNRQREIPGRNHDADAERDIEAFVLFAGNGDDRHARRIAQHFPSIVFHEIDRLGCIGIGFGPVLAGFLNQPGRILEFAPAQNRRRLEQQTGPHFRRHMFPTGKSVLRRFDRLVGQFGVGPGHRADDFREAGGVHRGDAGFGVNCFAGNLQRIVAAFFGRNQLQRRLHGRFVLGDAKIREWFGLIRCLHKGSPPQYFIIR